MKKRKPLSQEHKRSISNTLKGRVYGPLSDEVKRKIGDGNRGKTVADDVKKRISMAHLGKTKSEETKRKMSDRKKKSYLIENKNSGESFVVKDLIQWCKDNNVSYDPMLKSHYKNRFTRSGYKILKQINE